VIDQYIARKFHTWENVSKIIKFENCLIYPEFKELTSPSIKQEVILLKSQ